MALEVRENESKLEEQIEFCRQQMKLQEQRYDKLKNHALTQLEKYVTSIHFFIFVSFGILLLNYAFCFQFFYLQCKRYTRKFESKSFW